MFLLPAAVLIPLLAGLLLSAAAGAKVRAILSGGALLACFNIPLPVLAVTSKFFPRGSHTPEWIALGVLLGLALLGSLPPLTLLRDRKP